MTSETAWTVADGEVPSNRSQVAPCFLTFSHHPTPKTAFDPPTSPFSLPSRHTPPVVMTRPTVPALRWDRSWSQSCDQPQDGLEQLLLHRDLGRLEEA